MGGETLTTKLAIVCAGVSMLGGLHPYPPSLPLGPTPPTLSLAEGEGAASSKAEYFRNRPSK